MAITTRIAPHYGWRMLLIGFACIIFSLWGAYDLWIKIPRKQHIFDRHKELTAEIAELQDRRNELPSGVEPSDEDKQAYQQAEAELKALSPDGAQPVKPGTMDRVTQWFYISLIICAPYFFQLYFRAKKQNYTLDDDGTLHVGGDREYGSQAWKADEIVDVDMDRWMAKSIAHAVHKDGRKLKLDAYHHKNLDLIVGTLAAKFYPEKWDEEARPIKPAEADSEPEPAADA